MDATVIAAQNAVASAFIRLADTRWEHIIANVEVKQLPDDLYADNLAFAIYREGGEFKDSDILVDQDALDAIRALRQAMAAQNPLALWNTMELTVDRPGTYKFSFSYDAPKRVEGKHDHDSYFRFNSYVADYAARKNAGPRAAR